MRAIKNYLLRILFLGIFIVPFVISCKKQDDTPDYSYYVSKEQVLSFNKTYITSLINAAAITIPEVAALKPLVKTDVSIYRIVYTTTIEGKKVNVSGLVCVPSTSGEYPVLSFQNGTNTVNAFAPSKFPTNYSYQLIEVIASMGYVVVIADYPGFGESSGITHPYLVTEPTVRSLVDMLYAVNELTDGELEGISVKNEYYLLGYSQGGWATLALHKALELDYSSDFNLKGSACGAGPYDIFLLFHDMSKVNTYPMPVYLAYILNSYKSYTQFTNPVSDIFNEPYASRLGSLFNGLLDSEAINAQLTTSIPGLITPGFLSGFETDDKYSSIREALKNNSISGWHTLTPLLLGHGEKDQSVNPVSTESMYTSMINAGTSAEICKKIIFPGADHGDGVAPFIIQGILFLQGIKGSN